MTSHAPFILVSDKRVAELEKRLTSSLKRLYPEWVSDSSALTFKVTNRNQSISLANDDWKFYGNTEKLWVAFKRDEVVTSGVLKEIFELDEYANVKITELTNSIYEDFIDSNVQTIFDLADQVEQNDGHLEHVVTSFGSGAIVGNVSLGHALLPIALSGEMVLRMCNVKQVANKQDHQILPKLTKREQLLGDLVSSVEVIAGEVSISFDEFSRMEVGDVVMLNSKVDQPFKSRFSNGVEANVQLCKAENKTAIQFIE